MELRWQLHSLRKGSLTKDQYINKCKDLVDLLFYVGETLRDKEEALYVLGGKGVNYTSLVTNITNKKHILGLDGLFTCMKTHERKIHPLNFP